MNKPIHHSQSGLSIVELMVAMTIGLILMLGATGVLITNQRAFNATEGLSNIQESSRVAVDLISRDVREAGAHPCLSMRLFDQTNGNAAALALRQQLEQTRGLAFAAAGAPGNLVAGQDALQLITVNDTQIISQQAGTTLTFANDLAAGDIVIACTGRAAYLLSVTAATPNTVTVTSVPAFSLRGATVATGLNSQLWYIGSNNDGRINSLYRRTGNAAPTEMVDNIVGMAIDDLGNGATRVQLTLCSRNQDDLVAGNPNNPPLCGNRIQRTTTALVQRRTA